MIAEETGKNIKRSTKTDKKETKYKFPNYFPAAEVCDARDDAMENKSR